MTAHSGRLCGKTPVSINYRVNGLGLCDITAKNLRIVWFGGIKKKKHWVDFYFYMEVVYTAKKHFS